MQGFTLVEVAFSLAIMVTAIVTVMLLLATSQRSQQKARMTIYASAVATDLMTKFATPTDDWRQGQQDQVPLTRTFFNTDRGMVQSGGTPEAQSLLIRHNHRDAGNARRVGGVQAQPDFEHHLMRQGIIVPIPETIARRLDSPGDEIAKMLDRGGRLYYIHPHADVGSSVRTAGESGRDLARERLVLGIVGEAQQNTLAFHPVIAATRALYPFPPQFQMQASEVDHSGYQLRPRQWRYAGMTQVPSMETDGTTGITTFSGGNLVVDPSSHTIGGYGRLILGGPQQESSWEEQANIDKLDGKAGVNSDVDIGWHVGSDWSPWRAGLPEFLWLCHYHYGRIYNQLRYLEWENRGVRVEVPSFRTETRTEWVERRVVSYDRYRNPTVRTEREEVDVEVRVPDGTRWVTQDATFPFRGVPAPATGLPMMQGGRGTDIMYEDAESIAEDRWGQLRIGMPSLQRRVMYRTAAVALWAKVDGLGSILEAPLANETDFFSRDDGRPLGNLAGPDTRGNPTVIAAGTDLDRDGVNRNPLLGLVPLPISPENIHPAQVLAMSHVAHAAMLVTGYKPPFVNWNNSLDPQDHVDFVPAVLENEPFKTHDGYWYYLFHPFRTQTLRELVEHLAEGWQPGVSYRPGDYVFHNGEYYRPDRSHNSAPDNEPPSVRWVRLTEHNLDSLSPQPVAETPGHPDVYPLRIYPSLREWEENEEYQEGEYIRANLNTVDGDGTPIIRENVVFRAINTHTASEANKPPSGDYWEGDPDELDIAIGYPVGVRFYDDTTSARLFEDIGLPDNEGLGEGVWMFDIVDGNVVADKDVVTQSFRNNPDPRIARQARDADGNGLGDPIIYRRFTGEVVNPIPGPYADRGAFDWRGHAHWQRNRETLAIESHGILSGLTDTQMAAYAMENALRWAVAYTREHPYCQIVPKVANSFTGMDRPRFAWSIFDPSGNAIRPNMAKSAWDRRSDFHHVIWGSDRARWPAQYTGVPRLWDFDMANWAGSTASVFAASELGIPLIAQHSADGEEIPDFVPTHGFALHGGDNASLNPLDLMRLPARQERGMSASFTRTSGVTRGQNIITARRAMNDFHGVARAYDVNFTSMTPAQEAALRTHTSPYRNSWWFDTKGGEVADRMRQLVFWSVDWMAYEDAESQPSEPVDISYYNMHISGDRGMHEFRADRTVRPGIIGGSPEINLVWANPVRDATFINPPGLGDVRLDDGNRQTPVDTRDNVQGTGIDLRNIDYIPPDGGNRDWVGDNMPWSRMGLWGADRNGNGVWDRGPIPAGTRMTAEEVARFTIYDPVLWTTVGN